MGRTSIPRKDLKSTTEAIEPRKFITPLIQETTLGTGVTSARRSTPWICSAFRASSQSINENIKYCSPTTLASRGTFARSFGLTRSAGETRGLLSAPLPPLVEEAVPSTRRNASGGDCDSNPALRCNMFSSYNYTRRRTLFTSSSSLNGLVIYISAPCRNPQDLSSGVLLLVNRIMGICLLASRLLSLRHNWNPFCLGRTTSSTIHCGCSLNTFSSASSPSTAVTTSKPLLRSGVAIMVSSVQLSSTTSTFCPGISVYLSCEMVQYITPDQWERKAISWV